MLGRWVGAGAAVFRDGYCLNLSIVRGMELGHESCRLLMKKDGWTIYGVTFHIWEDFNRCPDGGFIFFSSTIDERISRLKCYQ